MTAPAVTHYLCPGCDAGVCHLQDRVCPGCGSCPVCGIKPSSEGTHCGCWQDGPPAALDTLTREFGIADEDVFRERRRLEIRRSLELRKAIVIAVVVAVILMAGSIRADMLETRTIGNRLISALITVLLLYAAAHLIQWFFRRIENRRLNFEFPRPRQRDAG